MKLRIVDDLNPEDIAMLQALYSRSAESVDVHLEKVKQTGSGKFMSNFYVGYGHKSIADCGSTTLFIENVSLLAAKAIQDWPLYSGQETSTRYIDMGKQSIVDPYGTFESKRILDRWMAFYTGKQDAVGEIIRARYPRREGEKPETYDRAVKARTFDVLRGFLPAGITTQLSWHTNLRQAGDHLEWMLHHPATEIVETAFHARKLLASSYPSSGFDRSMAAVSGVSNAGIGTVDIDERAAWANSVAKQFTYSVDRRYHHHLNGEVRMTASWGRPGYPPSMLTDEGTRYREMLKTRPRGCVLPHFMSDIASFTFDFLLDFGSFRDIQRHRNGVCRMPLLDTSWGFESWYLEQLGELRTEAEMLIEEQAFSVSTLGTGESDREVKRQYYNALGFRVPCTVTYGLPALLYVLELRAGKTVHPSLRRVVHAMIKRFRHEYPEIALHVDTDPDDWDVRRGDQTITEKKG
jgi:thymidylate synthase ThyX